VKRMHMPPDRAVIDLSDVEILRVVPRVWIYFRRRAGALLARSMTCSRTTWLSVLHFRAPTSSFSGQIQSNPFFQLLPSSKRTPSSKTIK
jgi:hypothetical protein